MARNFSISSRFWPSHGDIGWRVQASVYGIGLFSTSIYHMSNVIVPLYAITLDPTPATLGLVLAARHFLPLLLSIHAGALMDRLGARRIMIAVAAIGVAAPLLYPAMPWIWALIAIQMLAGFSDLMGWLGAQTMIGQHMHGRTAYAGRLSFVIRFGHLAGPPMAGMAWDIGGAWSAFAVIALWALGTLASALLMPAPDQSDVEASRRERNRFRPGDILPDRRDYASAFRLLGLPAVALVVLLGGVLHIGAAVQDTFYVVWLKNSGVSGTAIGTLMSVAAVGGAVFSLLAAPLARRVPGFWLLAIALWVATMLVCATPLLPSYALLIGAMFLRAAANGLAQPLVISLALNGAGAANMGKAVGLRSTGNRAASILAPLAMGGIAAAFGLEHAFYAIAAGVTVLMAGVTVYLWRRPDIARTGDR